MFGGGSDSFASDSSSLSSSQDDVILTSTNLVRVSSEKAFIQKNKGRTHTISECSSPPSTPPYASSPSTSPPSSPRSATISNPIDIPSPRGLQKVSSSPLPHTPDQDRKLQKKHSVFSIISPFKSTRRETIAVMPKSSSLPDIGNPPSKSKKDCNITVKVFEARNLPEARQRKKQAEKNSKAFKRAQKMILEFLDSVRYCMVQVEKMKMRTRTIEKKLNPFWCEEFTFEVLDPVASKVVLSIVDDKKYAQHEEIIGRLVLPINSYRDQLEHEQWYPLQHPNSTNKIPQIHMYIAYKVGTDDIKPTFSFQVLGGRNLGLGTAGGTVPSIDFTWKLRDDTVKEETFSWSDVHALSSDREFQATVETFNITLWRWKSQSEEDEEEFSLSPPLSPPVIVTIGSEIRQKVILGHAHIPIMDLTAPRDHWFCLYGQNAGLGDLRVKLKYTEEVVLGIEQYKEFLEILQEPNLCVVRTLGTIAKPNTHESIAYNLVRVFEKTGKAVSLLESLTTEEIESTQNPDIIFRGNSLATKSVDQYMKLVGMPFMHSVLKSLIKKMYNSNKTCEVDPRKLEKGEDLKQNWKHLIAWVNLFTEAIFESSKDCPKNFRQIFYAVQHKCETKYPGNVARFTAVSGFIFLRFFCPAILAPKLFSLATDHPGIKQTRNLMLIAKTLQNLGNLVEFGSVKEEFMKNMNEFVVSNLDNMRNFINNIAVVPETAPVAVPTETITLEKELASMYRHLLKYKDEIVEYHKAKGSEEKLMARLTACLANIEKLVKIESSAPLAV